jgi:hypothetical protein
VNDRPSVDDTLDELKLTRLADGLERFVRNLGAPPISILTQLEDRWPELVGPGLASTCRPVELVDGTLTVACTDPASASQIGWMEAQIIQRFTSTFNANLVQRVLARVDR